MSATLHTWQKEMKATGSAWMFLSVTAPWLGDGARAVPAEDMAAGGRWGNMASEMKSRQKASQKTPRKLVFVVT